MPYQILVPNSEIDKNDIYGTYTAIDDGETHDRGATAISCMLVDPNEGDIEVGFSNPVAAGTITSVELHVVGHISDLGVDYGYITPYLHIGSNYYGIGGWGYYLFESTSWTEFSKTWLTNPAGGAWAWTDLTDLSLLMEMCIETDGFGYVECTSAYLKVNYILPAAGGAQIIGLSDI